MTHDNRFLEFLPSFNHTDPVFKEMFGDASRPEFSPVTNINDINKGSLYNGIEWHLRYQDGAATAAVLTEAFGYFLKDWAKLLRVEKPGALSDEDFVGYIVGYILSGQCSYPKIAEIFPKPDFFVLKTNEFGFAVGVSAAGAGIEPPGPGSSGVSSIATPDRGLTYILYSDPSKLTETQLIKLNRIVAAGTAVYAGEF
ncbi:hypothetical protein EHO57_13850 [Leptospira langatensis]|uniref:Uncharacterized protein n=1 Tax=Leptospira langatensis TaxID=2484983 RepID=A0A5R2AT72_9LEPT|nr:hypothetical protein EHO57_13850 [Leptospira langatensis]